MKQGILFFLVVFWCSISHAQVDSKLDSSDLNRLYNLIKGASSELPDTLVETHIVASDSGLLVEDSVEILMPEIAFEHEEFDAGSIKKGSIVEHVFSFKNEGTLALTILGVSPDCSCSAPEWTASDIKPGKTGYVKIIYDSHDDIGAIRKTLTVLHNAGEGYTFLTLVGFVEAKF